MNLKPLKSANNEIRSDKTLESLNQALKYLIYIYTVLYMNQLSIKTTFNFFFILDFIKPIIRA